MGKVRVNLRKIPGKIDILNGKESVEYVVCYKGGKVSVKTLLKRGKRGGIIKKNQ